MIPREELDELISAHAALHEPTTGAIWINTGASFNAGRRKPELARAIADGPMVLKRGDAGSLVDLAREVSRAA